MLVACLALAGLVAFSLRVLVPVVPPQSAPDAQAENELELVDSGSISKPVSNNPTASEAAADAQAVDDVLASLVPAQVQINLSAGDLVVKGQLAGNRFSEVFVRALEAAAIKPLQNNLIQSDDAEPGSAWLFELAEAVGHLNQEFSEITLEVNEERLSLSGILSSEPERNRVFSALGKIDDIQWDPAESDVQVVAPIDPSLRIRIKAGKVSVSGEIAQAQREQLSNAFSGQLELTSSTWDGLETAERGYALPIVPKLPSILAFLTDRMTIVDVAVTVDTLEISGSYVADNQTSLFELEEELRQQLNLLIGEQVDQGMSLKLSSIDWELDKYSTVENIGGDGNPVAEDTDSTVGVESTSEDDSLQSNPVDGGTAVVSNSAGIDDVSELKSVVEELRTEFSDFEFDGASSVLNDEQMLILDQMFDTMFLYEDLLVTMGVNAFELDSAEQNLSLSQQRADSITDYLTGLGLESNKFLVIGRGDTLRVSDSSNTPGIILSFGQK